MILWVVYRWNLAIPRNSNKEKKWIKTNRSFESEKNNFSKFDTQKLFCWFAVICVLVNLCQKPEKKHFNNSSNNKMRPVEVSSWKSAGVVCLTLCLNYASEAVYCGNISLSAVWPIIYSCLFASNWFRWTQIDRSHEQHTTLYLLIYSFSLPQRNELGK